MSKGLFITGTGTDIGKTYVTALLIKKMRQAGYGAAYYKAAISGADTIEESDAGYVNRVAEIGQEPTSLVSYLYKNAVSPHLAAQMEGNPLCRAKVETDYAAAAARYPYVTVEGSGGIICPLRYDSEAHYFLEDVIKWLHLPCLIIARAGLGTINDIVLTVSYMQQRGLRVKGIILNGYVGGPMELDNIKMVEAITGIRVLGVVKKGATELDIDPKLLEELYE